MTWFSATAARIAMRMRIDSILPALMISTAMLCAEFAAAANPATAEIGVGRWHIMIVDGGRPRGTATLGRALQIEPASSGSAAPLPLGGDVDRSAWSLQLGRVRPPHAHHQYFGPAQGMPIAGDFNGDGFAEVGLYVDGRWFIDLNGNGRWDAGDLTIALGRAGDLPVVGDWNQDGKADVAVYTLPPGSTPETNRDRPVCGDWFGTGEDAIGVFRDGVWRLDVDGDGRLTSADAVVRFGEPGDLPVVGDFNRDGLDELGVYRRGTWYLDINGDHRLDEDDLILQLGDADDLPVVGDWDGDGRDQIGIVHRGEGAGS